MMIKPKRYEQFKDDPKQLTNIYHDVMLNDYWKFIENEYCDEESDKLKSDKSKLERWRLELITIYDKLSELQYYISRLSPESEGINPDGTPVSMKNLNKFSKDWMNRLQLRYIAPLNIRISALAERGANKAALWFFGLGILASIILSAASIIVSIIYAK